MLCQRPPYIFEGRFAHLCGTVRKGKHKVQGNAQSLGTVKMCKRRRIGNNGISNERLSLDQRCKQFSIVALTYRSPIILALATSFSSSVALMQARQNP